MGTALDGRNLGKGITQRKDGTYYGRVMVKGKSIEMYDKDLESLKVSLAAVRNQQSSSVMVSDVTVKEWFERWFDTYKAPVVKATSVTTMKSRVNNTVMPYIGKKKLRSLTCLDVQEAVNDLLKEGRIAQSSIKEAVHRLEECFAVAVNARMIAVNPAFAIVIPKSEEPEEERRWLSEQEIEEFLDEAKGGWWYEMLYFMIHTGLRIGEVSALRWSDIDWTNKCIHVSRSLATEYKDGQKFQVITTPKTVNSNRLVPFMADVEGTLRRQKERIEKLKADLGDRFRGKGEYEDLVFVTSLGSPVSRYNAERAIRRLVEQINLRRSLQAKIEKREPVLFESVYPHALRHTFASLCFKAGMKPKTVQKIMGHANYATTINIYTHVCKDDIGEDVELFNQLCSKTSA